MSDSATPRPIRATRATAAPDRDDDVQPPEGTRRAPPIQAAGRPITARAAPAPNGAGIGLTLLRCVLEAGSRPEWRRCTREMFLPDEQPAFTFIDQFYRRHGQLPSLDVMAQNNHRLALAPTAPLEYYFLRVMDRAQFNVMMDNHTPYADALRQQNIGAAVDALQGTLRSLRQFQNNQDTFTLVETAEQVISEYEVAERNPGIQGVSTGWPHLDEITGGLEPGDVGTFMARPGTGKSWLMIHSALTNWQAGRSILFVTNEMTHVQIVRRIIGALAGMNPTMIRRGQLSDDGRDVFYTTARNLGNGAPFHLVAGSFNKTVPAVDAAIQEFSPEVCYIDASYLMKPAAKNSKMGANELLANVMREIKEMALARRMPVWQSVQLNRSVKQARGANGPATPDLIHAHGSDEIGQLTTIGIGVMEGPAPRDRTSRKLNLMKVREGANDGDMVINFVFDPPNFDHIPTDENGLIATVNEDPEQNEWGTP